MEPRSKAMKSRGLQTFSDQELQMLLFAHGDVGNSLEPTKKVLDEIITDFIVDICFEADRGAQLAGRQKVKLDDFKWACRKDPNKLGKLQEVFKTKAEIDALRKVVDVKDDKITKAAVETLMGTDEPLGEGDDDQDHQAIGGRSTGTKGGR